MNEMNEMNEMDEMDEMDENDIGTVIVGCAVKRHQVSWAWPA
jgi:hypothetical protein